MVVPFDEYFRAIPNILLLLLGASFPFVIEKSDFQKLKSRPTILFISFVALLFLHDLIFNMWDENFGILKKILLSTIILVLYLPINNFKKFDKAIIFSALIAMSFSLYNIGGLIVKTGVFEFGNTRNPLDTLLIDRLYIGLLCIISILVCYRGITNSKKRKNRYFYGFIIGLNTIFIFLIVSRIAIITFLLIVFLRLFYEKIKPWKIAATFLGAMVIFATAYSINDNIEKRFLFTTPNNGDQSLIDKIMLWEPRTKIWDCAYVIASSHSSLFEGLGFEGTNKSLLKCYEWNIENVGRKEWFLHQKYNTHNQFLDFYLSTGIFSAILFLAFFILLFFKGRGNFFRTALLVSIFLFAFIENFFHRQVGAYLFGFILILLLLNFDNLPKKLKSKI